jgi:hypothetical protein
MFELQRASSPRHDAEAQPPCSLLPAPKHRSRFSFVRLSSPMTTL